MKVRTRDGWFNVLGLHSIVTGRLWFKTDAGILVSIPKNGELDSKEDFWHSGILEYDKEFEDELTMIGLR